LPVARYRKKDSCSEEAIGGPWFGFSPFDGIFCLQQMTSALTTTPNRAVIRWIMLGLVAWGSFLALGDYLANHNPRRPLVIISCVALFIGFWLAMLWRGRADESTDDPTDEQR
jgi:hypothetical protein